jgi:hypothetical protein
LGEDGRSVLLRIARCGEAAPAALDSKHPCHEVVAAQSKIFGPDHKWQLPTPWVGHLDKAPILFLGSNPNIGGSEMYPDEDWAGRDLVDFFDCAFDGATGQIDGGMRALRSDGTYGRWVRTWAAVRKRAEEILERRAEPGLDYAMAEIVHCRSQKEIGVDSARDHCANRYLDDVLTVSGAQLIVALGAHNRAWLRERFQTGTDRVSVVLIGGRRRIVAFLPHPTSYGPSTFAGVMTETELAAIRAFLSPVEDDVPLW